MLQDDFNFDGFEDATNPDNEINKLEPEKIKDLDELVVRENLNSKKRDDKFKKHFTTYFVIICLVILTVLVLIGCFKGNFTGADKWWGYTGPLVGFLIHAIYSRSKEGDNAPPGTENKFSKG